MITSSLLLTICFVLVTFSLFGLFFFRKQVLLLLLSLELVNLMLFLIFLFKLSFMGQYISFSFFLLILGACEASLGLSLMVVLTRFKGNDMLSEMMSFKC